MIREAIILAGGLGTRLREAVQDVPKCLAPVNGIPFIKYVLQYAFIQGIRRCILSVGYKKEAIQNYIAQKKYPFEIIFCEEAEPLGTGGAIAKAIQLATTDQVLVLNGDTFFEYQLNDYYNINCTLFLKPMEHFDRYGSVEVDEQGTVLLFAEKKPMAKGLINTGVYILNRNAFLQHTFPEKFSFEKDYLEKQIASNKISSQIQNHYFIDIGIPEDYLKAQTELTFKIPTIQKNTALFLDRDGVLNEEIKNDYVKKWDEFIFYPYTLEAISILSSIFNKIFIVTNQKGVGRNLMTEDDLQLIHQNMINAIEKHGGRIDHIYYCTATDNEADCRKPNAGMAFQALHDYPNIDLTQSYMVGNNLSDMEFGKKAGMKTILVNTTQPPLEMPHTAIDFQMSNLYTVAQFMQMNC